MKIRSLLIGGLIRGIAAATLLPVMTLAQANGPGRAAGPRSFAQWDKIEITVETKYGNNLAILHGSPKLDTTHPDAAGGRVMALYGPDGVTILDVRLILQTVDNQRIYVTYRGVVYRPPQQPAAGGGPAAAAAPTYFRITPVFETTSSKYDWLNRIVAVGSAFTVPGKVAYHIYEIL